MMKAGASDTESKWLDPLFAPVHGRSVSVFRILFGALIVVEMVRYFWLDWVDAHYIEPSFHFTYYGFSWVKPLPGTAMSYVFALIGVLALFIAAGWFYRLSIVGFFVLFTYVFLIDKGLYLNHLYLVILTAFLLIFIRADASYSLDALRSGERASAFLPAWQLWVLRLQLLIVYFYAGVSKIEPDWLSLRPLSMTMSLFEFLPLVGPVLQSRALIAAAAYGILVIELLAPVLLLSRRTRSVTISLLALFHVATMVFYNIGIFPWLCLAALTLFLEPDWPNRWRNQHASHQDERPARETRRGLVVVCLSAYLLVQLVVPLRQYLYPGNASWTRQGNSFAWRLLLSHKSGWARFTVRDPTSGAQGTVSALDALSLFQATKMSVDPDLIQQFAHFIADEQRAKGFSSVEVRADSGVSLNGRPMQPIVRADTDLASRPRSLLPADWIVPLREEALGSHPVELNADSLIAQLLGAERQYDRAQELHREARLDEAIRAYEWTLLLAPSHREAALNRALALKQTPRSKESRIALEKIVEDHPNYAPAHLELGILLYENREYRHAKMRLEKALELEPDSREALLRLTQLLSIELADPDGALELVEQALSRFPEEPALVSLRERLLSSSRSQGLRR